MRPLLLASVVSLTTLLNVSAQQPTAAAQPNVLPVQGRVQMITGAGVNISVHVG